MDEGKLSERVRMSTEKPQARIANDALAASAQRLNSERVDISRSGRYIME